MRGQKTKTKNFRQSLNSKYTYKNAQVVIDLQQTCSNGVSTTCQQDVFPLLAPSLLTSCYTLFNSTDLLQVVPTTCYRRGYRPATQQLFNKLLVTTL
jgi:hypothetical protein